MLFAAEPSRMELRKKLMQESQNELAEISRKEVSPESLGDWHDIIENIFFMLMRRTELFRGNARLLVYEDDEPKLWIYADGTIALSTALPDSIDSELFALLGSRSQRVRNFNALREQWLAPLCALELARFAQDKEYEQRGEHQLFAVNQDTAVLAEVLLRVAQYPRGLLVELLEREGSSLQESTLVKSLHAKEETIQEQSEYLNEILLSLQEKSISDETQSALDALEKLYPNTLYLARLKALIAIISWQNEAFDRGQVMTGFAPCAGENQHEVRILYDSLFKTKPVIESKEALPKSLQAAITDVERYLSIIDETGMISMHGILLLYAGNVETALQETAKMFRVDRDSSACVSMLNYASALYLSQKDSAKAKALLERCIKGSVHGIRSPSIPRGFCADELRLILLHALMLNTLEYEHAFDDARQAIRENYFISYDGITTRFRKIALGDTGDMLLKEWGKPSLISYNFSTERWYYKNMHAMLHMRNSNGVEEISEIQFLQGSPVNLPADIRVGDKRDDIEAILGMPKYYACDASVYFYNGIRFSIIYTNELSRSISVRKIYE